MPSTKKSDLNRPSLSALLIAIVIAVSSLWVYHNCILRPWDVYSMDFRRLSDAKLAQLTERAKVGQTISMAELESFIQDIQKTVYEHSQGRPVFIAGAVFGTVQDLTEEIAEAMQIDLTKNLDASLSGMANRLGNSLSKNLRNGPTSVPQQ